MLSTKSTVAHYFMAAGFTCNCKTLYNGEKNKRCPSFEAVDK